eukprot:PITA_22883
MALGSDPQSHSEAAGNPLWEAAMDEEYSALMENNTWDLVPLLKGRKLVRCRWIYRTNILAYDCPLSLIGYTDSDWVGDGIDRKSISGYVFSFGSGPFCWSSKKKSTIGLSTVEAEYRGAVNASTQAVWLQGLLSEIGIQYPLLTIIFCDNQGSIQILIDLVQRQRTRHIEIHMHYIYELIRDRVISLQYCPTEQQVPDIFTNSFTKKKFSELRAILGVVETAE